MLKGPLNSFYVKIILKSKEEQNQLKRFKRDKMVGENLELEVEGQFG